MELGRIQKMWVARIEGQGAYLDDRSGEPAVLLPRKEVPEDAIPGSELSVFLYKDSEDRLITTINPPPLQVGTMAVLKVSQINRIGAFLDWGLMKELFMPFQEQRGKVEEGQNVFVALYIDESERLCATMRVYEYLSANSPYRKDDVVKGTVYQVRDDLGALVAVDNRYYGLIPAKEIYKPLKEADEIEARVVRVCEDGKLDLALRKKAYAAMDDDAGTILESIVSRGGELPFTDKASPELIRDEFHMSKNEFKRAVGRLLKERKIVIGKDGIRLADGRGHDDGQESDNVKDNVKNEEAKDVNSSTGNAGTVKSASAKAAAKAKLEMFRRQALARRNKEASKNGGKRTGEPPVPVRNSGRKDS
jgi:predicted RNA-binding protein (virulence factor B family)